MTEEELKKAASVARELSRNREAIARLTKCMAEHSAALDGLVNECAELERQLRDLGVTL